VYLIPVDGTQQQIDELWMQCKQDKSRTKRIGDCASPVARRCSPRSSNNSTTGYAAASTSATEQEPAAATSATEQEAASPIASADVDDFIQNIFADT